MTDIPILTIDGPSGSGKGTISLRVAQALGWHMLDSGALYRLVALGAMHHHLALDDAAALAEYALHLDTRFEVPEDGGEIQVYLEGRNVTRDLRTETTGNAASKVAAIQPVRAALLERQRNFAMPPGLVADGRDMGTTVFPEAKLKIFLTASVEERAKRRYKQLKEKGLGVSLRGLSEEIAERDTRDSQRSVSPLKPADDAVLVDTSDMTIDEVVQRVTQLCRQAFAK
ncbi:MAG: (d)CMP kinase [Gammaproteobacteria bacterium]|nr:(d)CMP kinase [Gammaproteobacteria bacterium]MDH5652097.1 (d)CMP kinase [Gammaproteobacteria bacterium]